MALYDVDRIERKLREIYLAPKPPPITPAALRPLLDYLEQVTQLARKHYEGLAEWNARTGLLGDKPGDAGPGPFANTGVTGRELSKIRDQLAPWELRLANYRVSVEGCAAQNDPRCTLWSVVAPLFYGFYDGPDATTPQKKSDLYTPFSIANQLAVWGEYEDERTSAEQALSDIGFGVGSAIETSGYVASELVDGTLRALGSTLGKLGGAFASGLFSTPGGALLTVGAVVLGLLWFFGRPKGAKQEEAA